ncbi:ABC transporter permease [Novosphingobium sp. 1949]|uniref:ABC transporter permease n=1 Tax=Novosphingobium organovorum TaxID=2930092 RepID=A0ABT0BH72_9SPHN|nr:ABC transporter permease [Novosphingobium organovorum]MCJ2184188.1 ABC transporter permease [Novosphingobium organovorum]
MAERFTWSRLAAGWRVQSRVLHALMIRELTTRFGRENIGFLWMMFEPLLFAGLVSISYRLIHGPSEHGMEIAAFVVSGYIPITLFRHCVGRAVMVFQANGALMYHRQIKILDFVLVRFLIEFLGGMMAYVFIGTILMIAGVFPVPANIGQFLVGWFLYGWVAFGTALVIAPLSEMSEVWEKFIPVTTYMMLPVSGLFTMEAWLTPTMRYYLMWSPFVNAMELMRGGIWGDEIVIYYNIWNPIVIAMALTLTGLIMCRRIRRTLTVE